MFPLGVTLFIALAFGYLAFLSAINIFDWIWEGLVAAAIPIALIILGSVLNAETPILIAVGYSFLMFVISLIVRKIRKG